MYRPIASQIKHRDNGGMKILLITGHLPWPLEKNGATQRSGFLLRALQNWGEVDVLVAAGKEYFEIPSVIEKMKGSNGYVILKLVLENAREANPWSTLKHFTWGKFWNLLRDLGRLKADYRLNKHRLARLHDMLEERQYDVVVVRYLLGATRTGAAFLAEPNVLLDIDDIDWAVHDNRKYAAQQNLLQKIRSATLALFVARWARTCLANFSHVWVASEADRAEIGTRNCSVLPNVPILPEVNLEGPPQSAVARRNILFVAALNYPPNAEGLSHFLDRVWPEIHKTYPDVRLEVVGAPHNDQRQVLKWKRAPNVDFLGFVDDLDDVYSGALFTIAPIYWGGGTKIKVLESLGRGRASVVTNHALYGVAEHIRHDDSVWCADNDSDFADGCIALIENAELRQRFEIRGQEVVSKHFSVARFNRAVDDVMRTYR